MKLFILFIITIYFVTITYCAGITQVGYCYLGNNKCVAGMQRCGEQCNDCAVFHLRCGNCVNVSNCYKTCKDLKGVIKHGHIFSEYQKDCHDFVGY